VFTGPEDALVLAQGLPADGLILLVEPGHNEAVLVLAGNLPLPVGDAWTTGNVSPAPAELELTPHQAFELVAARQCALAASSLADALPSLAILHLVQVVPDMAGLAVPLPWAAPLPADGTWLLARAGPPRPVSLRIEGPAGSDSNVPLQDPSPPTASGTLAFRWDVINLEAQRFSFCYDEGTYDGRSSCYGNPRQDLVRAYSPAAATEVDALHAGLANGTWPLTFCLPEAQALCPPPAPAPALEPAVTNESASSDPASLTPSPLRIWDVRVTAVGPTWANVSWNADGLGADQVQLHFGGNPARCNCPPRPSAVNGTYSVRIASLAADDDYAFSLFRWSKDPDGNWITDWLTKPISFHTQDSLRQVLDFKPTAHGHCWAFTANVTGPGQLRPRVTFDSTGGERTLSPPDFMPQGGFNSSLCDTEVTIAPGTAYKVSIVVDDDRGDEWPGPTMQISAT
jgi:hypothetical protein